MAFYALTHPFGMAGNYPDTSHFFSNAANRQELLVAIKKQLKLEKGNDYVGEEKGDKLVAYQKITRNNFLTSLQEYATSLDQGNLEAIYTGIEQTRFNHLIEIRNSIGIYLPVFLMFPLRISIKQHALPIFVGSTVKLQIELAEIEINLQAKSKVKLGEIKEKFEAGEEDLEDYEAAHEGGEHFWPSFSWNLLDSVVKRSLQHKTPIFIFQQ